MNNNYDFCVSDKRKAVWQCEIELYEEFRKICQKHNLKYFAISGTLLGTIRHSGFIPWDDDIDVGMARNDYIKFLRFARNELPDWVFLQTPYTDKDYFFGHAKLRKKNTTAIRRVLLKEELSYHQGIFIDIFPLDNIPDNKTAHKIHRFVALKYMQMIYYAKYHYKAFKHSKKENIKSRICKLIMPNNKKILSMYKKFEKYVQKYNKKECSRWGLISVFYANELIFSWDKKDYFQIIEKPFENTIMPIPAGFNNILTGSFGDYMVPVRDGSQHGEIFYDVYNDYTKYLNEREKIKERDFCL